MHFHLSDIFSEYQYMIDSVNERKGEFFVDVEYSQFMY